MKVELKGKVWKVEKKDNLSAASIMFNMIRPWSGQLQYNEFLKKRDLCHKSPYQKVGMKEIKPKQKETFRNEVGEHLYNRISNIPFDFT